MKKKLKIGQQFAGPPGMANGGYTCGLLAREIDGAAVVTLRRPVPLETVLDVMLSADGAALYAGETLLAEARPAPAPQMAIPEPPLRDTLTAGYAAGFFGDHPFPNCFVCGPRRDRGKGLQVYPSPVRGRELLAAAWTPDAAWAGADGHVRSEFLWGALDCPGGIVASADRPRPILLGRLTATVADDLPAGEPCIVTAWVISQQGRKYITGTAIFDSAGRVRGCGEAIWIEPR